MSKIPPHRWSLEELDGEWRTDDIPHHRYQVGLSFLCPRHGRVHRLSIQLVNPFDGDPELFWLGAIRAYAEFREDPDITHDIGSVTLTHPAGGDDLGFGMCGRMRIVDGWVELVVNGT